MDKKRIKKLLTGILPFLLIVALLWMLPGRTVKPNNPISDKTTKLKTNFGTGGQSGKKKEQLKNGTDDKAQKNGNGSGTKTQEMSKENATQKKQKKTKKSSGSRKETRRQRVIMANRTIKFRGRIRMEIMMQTVENII